MPGAGRSLSLAEIPTCYAFMCLFSAFKHVFFNWVDYKCHSFYILIEDGSGIPSKCDTCLKNIIHVEDTKIYSEQRILLH